MVSKKTTSIVSITGGIVRACIMGSLFTANDALACSTYSQLDYTVFRRTDVILRAEITDYEFVPAPSQHAVLTIRTIDNLGSRGFKKTIWKADWYNSTYGVPKKWDGPVNVVLGIKAYMTADGDAALKIVQQPCGPRSIFPDTREQINAVLDGAEWEGAYRDKYR